MQPDLALTLFGAPQVRLKDKVIADFHSSKAQALLYYLAVTGRAHSRVALAGLFWGDLSDTQARVNLSKCLSNLRKLLGDHLTISRQVIEFNRESSYWLDVEQLLDAALSTEPIDAQTAGAPSTNTTAQKVDKLYQGDFLEGFYVQNAPEFEQWVQLERERLQETYLYSLSALAEQSSQDGDLGSAIRYMQKILSIEPWQEKAHRQLMGLYAQNGQRSAAIAQFESCRANLQDELAVDPSQETIELLEKIRDRWDGLQARNGAARPTATPAPSHNLPAQPTPFVGRASEIDDLLDRLADPNCRLLTLVGPGGIGKTRLSIEVATRLIATDTELSITFVPLAGVSSGSGLVAAIAQALQFRFYEEVPPRQQLLNFLKEKQHLLILDNFEQLVEEVELLTDILLAAGKVKLLVTSREALSLQEEWFYPVGGLAYPATVAQNVGIDGKADAVALFQQCALRTGSDSAKALETEDALKHILHICQLVDGIPLGIELATTWLHVMSVAEVAVEIEKGLDILTTRMRNVSQRHQSMRAVLEQSWALLNDNEQDASMKLAIFRDGFDRQAAQLVVSTSIVTLAALVEKSLLTVASDGSYQMHKMLQQFLCEKLQEMPAEQEKTLTRHGEYYLDLLIGLADELNSANQKAALDTVDHHFTNIFAAWQWALDHHRLERIHAVTRGLFRFYRLRNRYQLGKEAFSALAERVRGAPTVQVGSPAEAIYVQALVSCGSFHLRLGEYVEAEKQLQEALDRTNSNEHRQVRAIALNLMGQIAGWRGDMQSARRNLQGNLIICREIDHRVGMADTLHKLAQIDGSYGDYVNQKERAEESLAISRELGRPDLIAYALDVLGWATHCLGEFAMAEKVYRESLAIFEEIENQLGVALALGGIGSVAWAIGGERLPEAVALFQQSLALCEEIGHQHHLSSRYWYLSQCATDMRDYTEALHCARQGLTIAQKIGSRIFIAYNLNSLGEVAVALGEYATAKQFLSTVLQIAATTQHLPPLTMAMIHYADATVQEAANNEDPIDSTRNANAIAWLTLIVEHPGCWWIFKNRAQKLRNEILKTYPERSDLPPALLEPVTTLDAAVETIIRIESKSERGQKRDSEAETLLPISDAEVEQFVLRIVQLAMVEPQLRHDSPSHSRQLTERHPLPGQNQQLIEPLTPRELDVLQLMTSGMTNQQIADTLILSVGTVKAYTSNIYGKLSVANRTQAVNRARELQMFEE